MNAAPDTYQVTQHQMSQDTHPFVHASGGRIFSAEADQVYHHMADDERGEGEDVNAGNLQNELALAVEAHSDEHDRGASYANLPMPEEHYPMHRSGTT